MAIQTLLKKWPVCAGLFLGFVTAVGAILWFPIAPIWGSWAGFFSPKAFLVPLAGAFGGIGGSFLITAVRLLGRMLWGAAFDAHICAHYLPGLCASLSWATRSACLHVLLPVGCMVLFVAHPVGGQADYYSLYWLIPVALFGMQKKNIFFQSLSSTFIAHAVGSIIWLYTVPMSADMWRALIPVVAFERLVFAGAMTASYVIIAPVYAFLLRIIKLRRTGLLAGMQVSGGTFFKDI